MKKKKIKILLADDHDIVRSGLRTLFESSTEFSVIGEASDGEQAVHLAAKLNPDIVVMDISMPKVTGIEATAIIKKNNPSVRVLILTIHESEEYVHQMLHAGANGYVLKNAGKKEILSAVRTVVLGEKFFSPSISKLMIDGFVRQAMQKEKPLPSEPLLTKRETEILSLIAQGLTNREIAEALFLSVRTVNTHRSNMMQKLDVHETAGLVRYAIQHGLLRTT